MEQLSQPYISQLERYIVEQRNQNFDFADIAQNVGLPSADLTQALYIQTMEKLKHLCAQGEDELLEVRIDSFLEGMGIHHAMRGTAELACAIRLAIQDPSLLDSLKEGLYTAVGNQMNLKPNTVMLHICETISRAYTHRIKTGQDTDFYFQMGIRSCSNIRIKPFIQGAILYLNTPRPKPD